MCHLNWVTSAKSDRTYIIYLPRPLLSLPRRVAVDGACPNCRYRCSVRTASLVGSYFFFSFFFLFLCRHRLQYTRTRYIFHHMYNTHVYKHAELIRFNRTGTPRTTMGVVVNTRSRGPIMRFRCTGRTQAESGQGKDNIIVI